jgi:hypothetical protein
LARNSATSAARTLEATGLPPSALELEITETVFQTGPATVESLRQLRALGVAIALDDFGIGYSSLTSLEQLPISRVKLDRLLIAAVDSNPRSAAIVRSIVALCHGLGLQVVALRSDRRTGFSAGQSGRGERRRSRGAGRQRARAAHPGGGRAAAASRGGRIPGVRRQLGPAARYLKAVPAPAWRARQVHGAPWLTAAQPHATC